MNPQLIILSKATYINASGVATAAATYSFFSSDYEPPQQDRSIDKDVVHNQNGKFKYVYDNGPGFRRWGQFNLHCEQMFATMVGATAQAQYDRLVGLWEHPGLLGMTTPDGTYAVHWGDSMERSFRVFPRNVNDLQEFVVAVQFEEA